MTVETSWLKRKIIDICKGELLEGVLLYVIVTEIFTGLRSILVTFYPSVQKSVNSLLHFGARFALYEEQVLQSLQIAALGIFWKS
jgi:hypothetical protein